jgi:hypothetical protein
MKSKITSEDAEINVLHLLNDYADQNPNFKSDYLDSCDKFFENQNYLSPLQIKSLNLIYEKISNKISHKDLLLDD